MCQVCGGCSEGEGRDPLATHPKRFFFVSLVCASRSRPTVPPSIGWAAPFLPEHLKGLVETLARSQIPIYILRLRGPIVGPCRSVGHHRGLLGIDEHGDHDGWGFRSIDGPLSILFVSFRGEHSAQVK